MRSHYWSGIILIFIGLLLLVDEMNWINLEWFDILFYSFIVIGILKVSNGWGRDDKKGILGGTFFITFGLLMEMINNHYLIGDDEFVFAVFLLSLALANLVYFIVKNRWGNLTWAVILGAVGGLFLISYYGFYPSWYVYDVLETYWPVAIILLGVTLILRGFRKHHALT